MSLPVVGRGIADVVAPAQRQPAFVLHRRAYRETSAIVEYLTRDYGRIAAVVRGVRGRGRNRRAEPFDLLSIGWRGRGQLVTVTDTEPLHCRVLVGERLYGGLYLNELLTRTLRHEDPAPALFEQYDRALGTLAAAGDMESALRRFERRLLEEIGYAIPLDVDAERGDPLLADVDYRFDGEGFRLLRSQAHDAQRRAVVGKGADIVAIGADDYSRPEVRRLAKRLFRHALHPHLGATPLRTRQLIRQAYHRTPE